MATAIKLPGLGEGIEHGQIAKVLVSVGDRIDAEQTVLELETGKAVMEVPAGVAGVVKEVHVKDGDEIAVGASVITLDSPDAGELKAAPAAAAEPENEGDAREEPEAADAATAVAPPEFSAESAWPEETEPAPHPGKKKFVPASPEVRRFAREAGVDIAEVEGSGISGRVFRDDIIQFLKKKNELPPAAVPGTPFRELPDFNRWGNVRREKMSGVRRATAEQLTQSWAQIPLVTLFGEADITELEKLRRRYAEKAENLGGKLTLAVMVVKIAASALKVFPKLNASVDMQNHEVIFKEYVNLGIAMATKRGLLVPVVRNADRKNMVELAAEITALAERTRQGKVDPGELAGGTFTVTNIGRIWGSYFTPLINYPEVAILGMGRTFEQAVCGEDGKCRARTLLPLSLSFDHRLVDGADAANFLKWIVDAMHEPLLLALEG